MGEDPAEVLAAGRAFADLSAWRKITVSGGDAFEWLNDLVSADLSGLSAKQARHALLLSRTGAVRAAFTVTVFRGTLLLIQDPVQPSIADLLAPYVLSSDVVVEDRSSDISLIAMPGKEEPPEVSGAEPSGPSCLGSRGVDLICAAQDHDRVFASLAREFAPVSDDDIERFRISERIPRLGVDVQDGDLPQEALLSGSVSRNKGCFVGQEAVAKLDNLGRPRRLLVPFATEDRIAAGDPVFADGDEVGRVTSVARLGDETRGLARVFRESRKDGLVTRNGVTISVR